MTPVFDRLLEQVPAPVDADALWSEAISTAAKSTKQRGSARESPAERLRRMRDALQGELIAFHDALIVTPYEGTERPTVEGAKLWDVRVPLTLFPKRDHGFSRVECLVEFSNDAGKGVRVLATRPEPR